MFKGLFKAKDPVPAQNKCQGLSIVQVWNQRGNNRLPWNFEKFWLIKTKNWSWKIRNKEWIQITTSQTEPKEHLTSQGRPDTVSGGKLVPQEEHLTSQVNLDTLLAIRRTSINMDHPDVDQKTQGRSRITRPKWVWGTCSSRHRGERCWFISRLSTVQLSTATYCIYTHYFYPPFSTK